MPREMPAARGMHASAWQVQASRALDDNTPRLQNGALAEESRQIGVDKEGGLEGSPVESSAVIGGVFGLPYLKRTPRRQTEQSRAARNDVGCLSPSSPTLLRRRHVYY